MTRRATAQPARRKRPKAAPLNVLLIEDVEDDALLIVRHLEKHGLDVRHRRVETAADLRAALKRRAWDVVLCDHGMVGFNAMAALDIVKEHGLDPPFIVVSGTIGEEKAADVMRAGVHDLILKANLSRLIPAIKRELRQAEARRARAKADEELDMERRLLQSLMASLPVSIYFKDRRHRYLRLNEAEARILSAESAESVIGKPAEDFLPPDRSKMRREEEERIFATGKPLVDRIEEAPQKDGSVRWLAATKAPIRDRQGDIIGLVGITRDITRRKNAEDAVRANEALFRTTIDRAPAAIFINTLDSRYRIVNKMVCDWYAAEFEDIVGKTSAVFLEKHTADAIRKQERCVLKTKSLVEEEVTIAYPDGVTRDVILQKYPILDPTGDIVAIGTVIIDLTESKRIEAELLTKTRQLEVVLETMDQGMYAVDENLTCTLMNRRFVDMYDLPPELGRPGIKFEELVRFNARKGRYGPGDIEEHVERRTEIARQNRPIRYEFDLHNGRVVEIRSNPLPDGGLVRTSTDITERKQMDSALRESEEKFRTILESLPTAVSLRDRDGRYLLANKTLCAWMDTDVAGKSVFDLYPEETAERLHQLDLEVFANGKMTVSEVRLPFPDGMARSLVVHRSPLRSPAGDIAAVSNIATDITPIKKAEEELRKYSQAVHQSPASVIIADTDGTIEYVNTTFTEMTGFAAEEAIGQNPRFLKSGVTPPEMYENMWTTITAGRVWRGTFHNKRKDGGLYLAGATVFPITAEDGTVTHYVGTQQDITQRIAEQNRLKQAEKLESLGSLAGGIAHDFNNMLLPIIALTDMTLKKLPDDSEHRPRLERVRQAANRAKALVAQILAFSRKEEAKQKATDIGKLVKETLELLRTTLPSTVTIKESCELNGAKVFVDAGQIETVLMNLATNASHAMQGKPGRLEIALTRAELGAADAGALRLPKPGHYARLRVKDTGHGMDEATMKRIFEPFFTTKAVGKGTGLGLATAFGIITKHGGVIDVASELGKGTTFDVYLPLMSPGEGAAAEPVQESKS